MMRSVSKKPSLKTADIQTKYGIYAVTFERDGRGYAVSVPRRPEVATYGNTLTDAKRMAQEAIEVAIEGEVLAKAEEQGAIRFSRGARKVLA